MEEKFGRYRKLLRKRKSYDPSIDIDWDADPVIVEMVDIMADNVDPSWEPMAGRVHLAGYLRDGIAPLPQLPYRIRLWHADHRDGFVFQVSHSSADFLFVATPPALTENACASSSDW